MEDAARSPFAKMPSARSRVRVIVDSSETEMFALTLTSARSHLAVPMQPVVIQSGLSCASVIPVSSGMDSIASIGTSAN